MRAIEPTPGLRPRPPLARPGASRAGGPGLGVFVIGLGLLVLASVALQIVRDRVHAEEQPPAQQLLYFSSGEALKRLTLSYESVAADIYWIRAIQAYGAGRLAQEADRFDLLYPLLDITTTLDPHFTIAYRFGAVFLSEPPPGGPGRPDLAIALLEKGMRVAPGKWEYVHDVGFVHYWHVRDMEAAAQWFRRAGDVPGAPEWLLPLAAVTLAEGGRRSASRFLWQQIQQTADHEWLRAAADRRLLQLEALDEIERLEAIVRAYARERPADPLSWPRLVEAGVLARVPGDPAGTPYELNPWWGDVTVAADSPLFPLPAEPQAHVQQPHGWPDR
jgi:hypothetical protein